MLCPSTMHLERRLLAGLACAVALLAPQVRAQPASPPAPPETLETPYEDTPPPAPTAPPPAVPVAPPAVAAPPVALPVGPVPPRADSRPDRPIRALRKLALMGEVGWNGLAGFGPVLTYNATPHLALDLGAGLSLMGGKVGARARYNLLTSPMTPFVGVGATYAGGFGQQNLNSANDPHSDPTRGPVTLELKRSYLIQSVIGFDLIHKHGFTMLGCAGYSWLLNHDNVDVIAGKLSADEQQAVNVLFKSGVVISLAAGYAFE